MTRLGIWGCAMGGLLLPLVGGCGPRASQGGFHSDNPAAKMYAIRQAAATGDRAAIPHLVEQLDSDDPAVRMLAIRALEELTGQRLGYNPYAQPPQRQEAVARWVEAVHRGRSDTNPDHLPAVVSSP